MQTEKQVEKWLTETKEQIREQVKRGEYNSYTVGYYNALCDVLYPSPVATKEGGTELWERIRREENESQNPKSRQTPIRS